MRPKRPKKSDGHHVRARAMQHQEEKPTFAQEEHGEAVMHRGFVCCAVDKKQQKQLVESKDCPEDP